MDPKSNKLFVLEGTDGCGKETQTRLLLERMRERGPVTSFAFPRYETPTGALVKECLGGMFGDFRAMHPKIASTLYIDDFLFANEELVSALWEGSVLLDRFTPSNMAYQSAKLTGAKERREFIAWLERHTHDVFDIPEPDHVIFLHVPPDVSRRLRRERGGEDQHEADLSYQREVIEVYHALAAERPNWYVVECAPDGENILSKDVIHEKIWRVVEPLL